MKLKKIVGLIFVLAILLAACQPAVTQTTAPEAPAQPEATQPEADAEAPQATEASDAAEAPASTEPKIGGQLVVSISADPKNLDPATLSGWDQAFMASNVLEGLFRLSPDGLSVEMGVAKDYTVSEDGLTWTFIINENAKFHNGRNVVAQDVKYSFERVLDPNLASPKAWMLASIAGVEEFQDGTAADVSGIKVIDDQTVEITLSEPLAPFKSMLTSVNLAVVPQEEVEKWGDDFGQHVVSAGPFKLGAWNINQDLTLEAFTDYANGRPYVDSVLVRFIGDENTRVVEFDSGRLDITWVPPAQWDRINADAVLKEKLGWAHSFHTEFLAVNLEKEPFGTNVALRKAIRYALDLDAIVVSLQNRQTVAQELLGPGLLGFKEDANLYYPRDLEKAKELMAEAGFENGVPGTFDLIMPNWGNLTSTMQLYQANLQEIGININIVPMDYGAYLAALDAGDYVMAWAYRVPDYADPDGFYNPLLLSKNIDGGGNWARYQNTDVDALVEEARAIVDDAARAELYGEVETVIAEDLPYIPLTHNIYVDVSQGYVMNYMPNPMDITQWHRVWLDK